MSRRVAVPALFVVAAAGVGYALVRLRQRGPETSTAPRPLGDGSETEYVCDCGQAFRVSGAGRHRVYWLPDASPADPVVSAECPSCGRPLPREQTVTGATA